MAKKPKPKKKPQKKAAPSLIKKNALSPRAIRSAFKVKPRDLGGIKGTDFDDADSEDEPRKRKSIFDPPQVEERIQNLPKLPDKFQELVTEDMSDEKKALLDAGRRLDQLLADPKKDYKRLLASMTAFRQCYVVAYRELQERLAEEENIPVMLEDLAVGSSSYEASKAFSEHVLMRGITESVLPWLADVIDRHSDLDETRRKEDAEENEKERRTRPIPIGFPIDILADSTTLDREQSLILVGWEPALLWLADQITNHVLVARDTDIFTVVRLMVTAPKSDQHTRLIRLSKKYWQGCANDKSSMAYMMGNNVEEKLTYQPDLIICDNLTFAHTKSFVGRPDGAVAGDANKRMSHWCKEAGCGLVGLIPIEDRVLPDLREQEYDQLRAFTQLRGVQVLDEAPGLEEGHYRISLTNAAATFDVAKPVIEAYGRSRIIVAGGNLPQ